jgi:hypothetical protein
MCWKCCAYIESKCELNVVLGMTAYKLNGTTLKLQLHKLAEQR